MAANLAFAKEKERKNYSLREKYTYILLNYI